MRAGDALRRAWCPAAHGHPDHGDDAGSTTLDEGKGKMSTKKDTKTTVVALARQLIAGTEAKLSNVSSITFDSRTFTPAELTTALNRVITLRSDVDTAKAATKAKLEAERTEMPALRAVMRGLVQFIKVSRSAEPDVLAAFGITPKARTAPSAEAKAVAVAKRASTREARHTMGPVAKKRVKGTVTGGALVPTLAPEPVVTPATPASPSPGANAPAATATPAPRTPST
jgi:hypothetical protein